MALKIHDLAWVEVIELKINEVERVVGITKKNIRFYEEQGLIAPKRGANGYREYSEEDLEMLLKIRLLRRLAIPIEEIRKMQDSKLSLRDCLERHQIYLNHEKQNINIISKLCEEMGEQEYVLSNLPTEMYLEKINEMEKGGTRFLDVEKVDVGKKKRGAIFAAIVMIILMALWEIIMFIGNSYDPIPTPVLLLMTVPPVFVVVGILIALKERMKEIEGGEADEAVNY